MKQYPHTAIGRTVFGLVAAALVFALPAVSRAEDACAPGVVLVKFRANAEAALVQRIVTRHGLQLHKVLPRIGARRFRIPAGQNETLLARLLASYPQVEYAEPDYVRYASFTPNDPRFGEQWDMARMRMPLAWDSTRGSNAIVVAVLDTGIDLTHPDLVNQLWINADEIPGNGRDDDGNGYVDDRNGFDFAGDGAFPPESRQDPIPNDTGDHGSHVSGTVAAQQNNAFGISGVAPQCKVMAVKVLGGFLGSGFVSDIVNGIAYAVDNGARVLNMSLGGSSRSLAEYNALKYAWDHDAFVAAAAGNSGDGANPIEYPAGYPFAMSVGATDQNDAIGYFSTHNGFVEVAAPGVNILSTIPGGGFDAGPWSGTSMACPHVAGVAALLFSLHPGIDRGQVRAIIQRSVVDLGPAGWDEYFGYGRLDALTAVTTKPPSERQLEILTPAPGSVHKAGALTAALWTEVSGAVSYRIQATLPSGAVKIIPVSETYYTVHPATFMPTGDYRLLIEALAADNSVLSSDTVSFRKTN